MKLSDIPNTVRVVQQHLTPDLLKPEHRGQEHPHAGHCYVASEALYHLGLKELGYTPVRGRDPNGVMHWWLRGPEGHIVDATAGQYTHPPYAEGVPGGFLTKRPSMRAIALLFNVRQALKNAPPQPVEDLTALQESLDEFA
jgi:hypothetical protein